jgi:hypothetical protein
LAAPDVALPYEWAGEPGLLIPWLGEELTLCLGRHGKDWLAATREPAMAAMAGEVPESETINGDLHVRLHWNRFADVFLEWARNAALAGMITGLGSTDVDERIAPQLRALGTMGALELRADAQSDQVIFEGMLARAIVGSGQRPTPP